MIQKTTNAFDAIRRSRSPQASGTPPRREKRQRDRDRDDREHLRLQASGTDDPKRRPGATRKRDQRALEQLHRMEPSEQGRIL